MPIKTEALEEPTLILTPMVDIVMLIMIFFMVSTEFRRRESQYEIQLPKVTDAKPLTPLPDELVVNVTDDGTIYIGTEKKTIEELEAEIRAAHERYAEQVVVIRGDGEGRYQNVMTVLNLCKRTGIRNIQLANRIDGEGGP
ncbi:ExbD/TolR family protein [Planctomicrobium piriforme]|uniref:Biopolymer transport protein ExbD n=1 Tax=Planctomicrobium piriforme TaxID=1576369 RepID=A0A1I3NDG9_9PLAN|nr:biopolymer transporter ExbD [Planctomicrobium piriforme]SFJ07229.1 biopolymer transport protein ExbD [Planctomicrobium piriforme]